MTGENEQAPQPLRPERPEENYAQAAVRYFRDAEHLAVGGRWDNAGHLLGFAAECAIKFAIVELRSGQGAPRKHMPELVDDAKKCFHGRVKKHGDIKKVVQLPTYFSGWDVSDRYRPDDAVDEAAYSQWHEHARRTLGAVKLLGRR